MIDYDKLKLAMTLCQEYSQKNSYIGFECHFNDKDKGIEQFYNLYDLHRNRLYSGELDNLITNLRELTQPKAKYAVGSRWWYLDEADFIRYPKPKSLLITEENKNWYRCDEEWHPTKQSLIESQIEYWQKLRDEPVTEYLCDKVATDCQHDTGLISATMLAKDIICKKCYKFIHLENIIGDCNHESDKMIYFSNPPQNKCIKCGMFYQ